MAPAFESFAPKIICRKFFPWGMSIVSFALKKEVSFKFSVTMGLGFATLDELLRIVVVGGAGK